MSPLDTGGAQVVKAEDGKQKQSPDELQIAKDAAELDTGEVTGVNLPNPNEVVFFLATAWEGGKVAKWEIGNRNREQ